MRYSSWSTTREFSISTIRDPAYIVIYRMIFFSIDQGSNINQCFSFWFFFFLSFRIYILYFLCQETIFFPYSISPTVPHLPEHICDVDQFVLSIPLSSRDAPCGVLVIEVEYELWKADLLMNYWSVCTVLFHSYKYISTLGSAVTEGMAIKGVWMMGGLARGSCAMKAASMSLFTSVNSFFG